MADKKSVLLVNRHPPYGSNMARDTLDVALTCGIFDLPISLLFLGDGLYQLLDSQNPKSIEQKSLQAMLSALPMYDIDQLYVCAEDLAERDLTPAALYAEVKVVDAARLPELFQQHSTVLTF
ncbi:sulfurtransferase complex subunit TusC [Neptuniibacter sp. CAU 1671]|uniref:sulfurtransferase complex subunit TusC n=1 Tax=Neptuniibacter sp. CAU 1671 TaxID=3032593 RepID=UPI0023DA756F|nr:sulfurtransferase complex subunit TusC [Neptuniibacter sp. CAU 1671]MDF2180507.1 sulfurtransferase complex subunit TusC [Neptuniibacter sp. CAU 1671]